MGKQTMDGPKFSKRKHLGKNKKKSWRGIDISETENFLEDQRFQLRTTGLFSEKPDDQLFVVARQGDDASARKAPKRKVREELNCYSNLVNRSRIECPRKEYPTTEGYTTRSVKAFSKKSPPKPRRNKTSDPTTTSTETQPQTQTQGGDSRDLWSEEDKKETKDDDFFCEVTKRKRVKAPKNMKRSCSKRVAVEAPHPGASVNPSYNDHQDLLLQAHVVEMKKEKAERKIFNALDAKFPSLSEAPSQETWIAEMSAGLYDDGPAAVKEEVDDSHISLNPPVSREKKKTPSQKRKEKAAKLLKHVTEQQKTRKGTENKVFSIARIKSQLAEEKREQAMRAVEKSKKEEAKKSAPKKLGKLKVEAPDLELKLTEELVGNLRSVKPEGHLLEDRYKSLQMRNLVEARGKAHKKKTKTKIFEKKSFRDITA